MLDFTSRFGRRVQRRLRGEKVIWLTTVDAQRAPQPRPVWFHWDGKTILIFSQKRTAKLRHIAGNPRVALNFNSDEDGEDVGVLTGEAKILRKPPPRDRVASYLRKYRKAIADLGMTVEDFSADYSVPIVVEPATMRGF